MLDGDFVHQQCLSRGQEVQDALPNPADSTAEIQRIGCGVNGYKFPIDVDHSPLRLRFAQAVINGAAGQKQNKKDRQSVDDRHCLVGRETAHKRKQCRDGSRKSNCDQNIGNIPGRAHLHRPHEEKSERAGDKPCSQQG